MKKLRFHIRITNKSYYNICCQYGYIYRILVYNRLCNYNIRNYNLYYDPLQSVKFQTDIKSEKT